MARLEHTQPLVTRDRGLLRQALADGRVKVHVDESDRLAYDIEGDSSDVLKFDAGFSPSGTLTTVTVAVIGTPTPPLIQRFNRLFKDLTGELLWYHRSGDVQYHLPGTFLPLPVEVRWTPDAVEADRLQYRQGTSALWSNANKPGRVAAAGKAIARAAVAPVAPSAAPAPVAAPRAVLGAMSAKHGDPRGLFKYPVLTKRSEVKVKVSLAEDLDSIWDTHISGHREVMAVVGPTGTAKTSLAFNLAARRGIPIMTFDAVGAREFSDWVGTTHLRGDRTEFVPSGFLQAVDADGDYAGQWRIVLVDEVNRAESTGSLNALIPMLHDYMSLYVPELGRAVAIDPTVMFVLTANRGSMYGGTIGLDAAFTDRVTSWVRMDYLEMDVELELVMERTGLEEDKARRLCQAAQRTREAARRMELPESGPIGTRRLLNAAVKAKQGMSLQRAASLCWLGSYPDEGGSTSEWGVINSAIDGVLRGL